MGSTVSRLDEFFQTPPRRTGRERAGPYGWHDKDSDSIFFFAENAPYTAEWVDDWVTVYRRVPDGEIIGVLVKWVGRLKEQAILEEMQRTGNVLVTPILTVAYEIACTSPVKRRPWLLRWLPWNEPVQPPEITVAHRFSRYLEAMKAVGTGSVDVEQQDAVGAGSSGH